MYKLLLTETELKAIIRSLDLQRKNDNDNQIRRSLIERLNWTITKD